MTRCSQHPEVPAGFHCEACGRHLCAACTEESHALFICRQCGERALPLGASSEQTPTQRAREARVSRHYTLKDALVYPFRDAGGRFTLAGMVVLLGLVALGGACLTGGILRIFLTMAIAGLQFKIVRKTMDGHNEVPYWTDWEPVELFLDWLAWLGIMVLQWALPILVAWDYGLLNVLLSKPSLLFWLAIALGGWIGTALSLMALGAAANYGRWNLLAIPQHFVAFRRAGGDAVAITNLAFGLGAAIPVAKILASPIPLAGTLFGVFLGAYWALVLPHLCGLLFARHSEDMDAIYM